MELDLLRRPHRSPNSPFSRFAALALAASASLAGLAGLAGAQSPPPAGKMWLLEDAPVDYIAKEYGVELDETWLERTQLSGLRYGGGTASFVSPDGLMLTNHHVVRGDLSRMEHEGKNLGVYGYVAQSLDDELPIPGASVRQLVEVEDVTGEVFDGLDLHQDWNDLQRAINSRRQGVLARARAQYEGLVPELVSMYRGGRIHLYLYEVYTDVRLVFAPELGAGYFGGDTDNFRYPRYALDFSLCRVYEDGVPLDSSAFHFTWSDGKFEENDVVFSLGNPGSTDRMLTVAELEFRRDAYFPAQTGSMGDFLDALHVYAKDHPEQEHSLREMAFGLANGQKANVGKLQGLRDAERMEARKAVEKDVLERLHANEELDAEYGEAWDEIDFALEELEAVYERYWYQTPWYGEGRWIRPMQRAMQIVEDFHPDFVDENRIAAPSTDFIYPFDPEVWALHLARGREVLGEDDPGIAAILQGREPKEAIQALVEGTRITSKEFENELRNGGWDAIEASDDPAIVIARELYPLYVENLDNKRLLEAVVAHQALLVGRAIDALEGPVVCPEATFTARLSAGRIESYAENGTKVPAMTDFAGLFERCAKFNDEGEFDLPDSWFEAKDELDLGTKMNFVCTVDSTGGSSGSPIFDQHGRIVGVLFDGNEQSTENEFVFEDEESRAIVVHSDAILRALEYVYDAPMIADELRGGE